MLRVSLHSLDSQPAAHINLTHALRWGLGRKVNTWLEYPMVIHPTIHTGQVSVIRWEPVHSKQ